MYFCTPTCSLAWLYQTTPIQICKTQPSPWIPIQQLLKVKLLLGSGFWYTSWLLQHRALLHRFHHHMMWSLLFIPLRFRVEYRQTRGGLDEDQGCIDTAWKRDGVILLQLREQRCGAGNDYGVVMGWQQ